MPPDNVQTSSDRYLATLVRGEVHYLREIRFDHGVPTVVEEYHRDHLLEHAFDVVPTPGWSEEYDTGIPRTTILAKFRFEPYAGDLDVGETIGASVTRDGVDEAAAARLRRFSEREAARLAKAPVTVPRFDPAAHRAEIEQPAADDGEPLSAPRARPPSFPRRA